MSRIATTLIITITFLMFMAAESYGIETKSMNIRQLTFTENLGQWAEPVRFRAEAGGATLWFTEDGAIHQFSRTVPSREHEIMRIFLGEYFEFGDPHCETDCFDLESMTVRSSFVGAMSDPRIMGSELMEYRCNYFFGRHQDEWYTDVPNYRAVVYEDIYPDIDVKYYGNADKIEYDFICAPWADISQIRVEYDGADSLYVNDSGALIVATEWGDIVEQKPYVYQEYNGERVEIETEFKLTTDNTFTFQLSDDFSPAYAVVIDPTIVYSSYLGGSSWDFAYCVALDESNNIYLAGETISPDFPLKNPMSTDHFDPFFITKMNNDGTELIYSTYFSSCCSGFKNHRINDMTVDKAQCVYLTGVTFNDDYPVTMFAFDSTHNGSDDAFVTKLSSTGNALVYSTFLGGEYKDHAFGIAVDGSGQATVAGWTESADFPVKNAYDIVRNNREGFVTKLNSCGSDLLFSTFYGGSESDMFFDLAQDEFGNLYAAGGAMSSDFPAINAFDPTLDGDRESVLVKLSGWGVPIYSTYTGGGYYYFGSTDRSTNGCHVAVDKDQNVYLAAAGNTVTKLNGDGDQLVYSIPFSNSKTVVNSIAVDPNGYVYLTGETNDYSLFPLVNELDDEVDDLGDAFITKINSVGEIVYSTYLGESEPYSRGSDEGMDIAVDANGNAYVAGYTNSLGFPVVNAYADVIGNLDYHSTDAFLTIFSDDIWLPPLCGDTGFRSHINGWGFSNKDGIDFGPPQNNEDAIMWPRAWWEPSPGVYRFDYCRAPYSPAWCLDAEPDDFPDWPLFVDAFGEDQCYGKSLFGFTIPKRRAYELWKCNKHKWEGSCFGFAVTAGLIFNGRLETDLFPASTISDERRLLINKYFVHQLGYQHQKYRNKQEMKTPVETLIECQNMFRDGADQPDDKCLEWHVIWTDSEAKEHHVRHALNPYGCEQDEADPNIYRIFFYNSNLANREDTVTIDIDQNLWYYKDFSGLYPNGLSRGLFMMDPLSTYLDPPLLKSFDKSNEYVAIYTSSSSDLRLESTCGSVGIESDSFYNSLPDGIPITPINSSPSNPLGYFLPTSDWKLYMSGAEDTSLYVTLFGDRSVINYERIGVCDVDEERLIVPEGGDSLWIENPGSNTREYTLDFTMDDAPTEFTFRVSHFSGSAHDSVLFSAAPDGNLQIDNHGDATTYDLEITKLSEMMLDTVYHADILIGERSAQRIPSNWSDYEDSLIIRIDHNLSGDFLDSIILINYPTAAESDQGSVIVPNAMTLGQNYPNPFNPNTRIEYSIPRASRVTIVVFNLLGQKVRTLVNEEIAAGSYAIEWDGTNEAGYEVTSGVYFYRLSSDGSELTKKMLLVR